MNVANLENSKRLYELSRWRPQLWWLPQDGYLLGYLLGKLPRETKIVKGHFQFGDGVRYHAHYSKYDGVTTKTQYYTQLADTPEDAAALLAIKLFEEKIL